MTALTEQQLKQLKPPALEPQGWIILAHQFQGGPSGNAAMITLGYYA